MRLAVDYLLVHEGQTERLLESLRESLISALEENGMPVENVGDYLLLKYSQLARNKESRRVSAFHLDVEVDEDVAADFLKSFEAGLPSSETENDAEEESEGEDKEPEGEENKERESVKVFHILKFGDPLLKRRLAQYADELFDLEMSLREALSAVFLMQYGDDFYNLLRKVAVKFTSKKKPEESKMAAALENEFFHLLFKQYTQLNERKKTSNVSQLLEAIGTARDFEDFRREITRHPIAEESHRDFIASLKERMDSIEQLRNSVAHNRAIPDKARENYEKARDVLKEEISRFITSLSEAQE